MNKTIKKIMINGLFGLLSSITLSWSAAELVSDTAISFSPCGCENDSGNAAVTWVSGSYPDCDIKSALFDGTSWSSPTTISSTGANVTAFCGMDSLGNIVAVWQSIDGQDQSIMSSRKPVGESWDTPITLSSSLNSMFLAFGINANGQSIAAWSDFNNSQLQVVTLNFGDSWSSITNIESSDGHLGNLKLDIDPSGNGIVVCESFDTGVIYASQTTGGLNSSWATPVAISSTGTNTGASLKVNSSGDAIAAWTNVDTYEVDGALYLSGSWQSPEKLSANGPDDYAAYPSVAVSDTDFFISYTNFATSETDGNVTVSGVWGTPFQLSPGYYTSGPASAYSSGTFYTVCTDNTIGYFLGTAYPVGGPVSSPVILSGVEDIAFTAGISASSAITLATWDDNLGSENVVKVNRN